MAILWHAIQRLAKPGDALSPRRWFAQAVVKAMVGTDKLAKRVADQTGISAIMVKAVIDALVGVIIEALLDSESVELKGFIFLYPSTGCKGGSDTPAGVRLLKKVAKVNVRYAQSFLDQLAAAKFHEDRD